MAIASLAVLMSYVKSNFPLLDEVGGAKVGLNKGREIFGISALALPYTAW